MSVLDLTREARRAPMRALPTNDLDAADRAAAHDNWRNRMASEHASARVFAALVGPMMRAGLPAAEIRRVTDMARQELDHGLLCARVLAALGAEPVAEMPRLDPVPEHDDAVSALEVVLRSAISIGCCSETVAVALVATEREQAGPPEVQEVLDQILRDEIKHARFGWRTVSRLAPTLSRAERESLDAYLVDVFDHQITFHSPFLAMPCASDAGVAVGAPHGRSNWAIFTTTMQDIVVPGLEQCGLSARAAWTEVSRPSERRAPRRRPAP